MKNCFSLYLKSVLSFIKNTLGLTDKLTFFRHVIISIYSWILSPILFQYFSEITSGVMMFIFMLTLTGFFLKISAENKEKSLLLDIISKIYKNKKLPIMGTLFLTEPFLFIVYYRDTYYRSSTNKNKKLIFVLVLILSSMSASGLWAVFIHFFGKDIFYFIEFIFIQINNLIYF